MRLTASIRAMRRGQQHGRPKPHKPVMLLALVDCVETGLVTDNKFEFSDSLIAVFNRLFAAIAERSDWRQAAPPFFHLRSDGFWRHEIVPGKEQCYRALKTSGGGLKRIRENIAYGAFEPWAWRVVCDAEGRASLTRFILDSFFEPDEAYRLRLVLKPNAPTAGF